MQRDALKPLFTRSKKEDALLPSVVVLPKIGNDRKDSEFTKDANRCDDEGQVVSPQRPFLGGRRVSKTGLKPTVSPKSDLLAERRATGGARNMVLHWSVLCLSLHCLDLSSLAPDCK